MPHQEECNETTESQRVRAAESYQYRLRGGTRAPVTRDPHGDERRGTVVSYHPLTPSGHPGPILPGVGRVFTRARRPSSPTSPR